ncbi:MAG: hypothetical protein LC132_11415, partial [Burkholderiales bacterium]|nr:hypothetical protein [Burkholderiales bacterium]
MKVIVVAGTPGAGKTSVLLNTIKFLKEQQVTIAVAKIDCLYTEDHIRFKKTGIPTLVGLSRDMCPDHYTIYNMGEMVSFASEHTADMLIV